MNTNNKNRNDKSPMQLFEYTLSQMYKTALKTELLSAETVLVPQLIECGRKYTLAWLQSEEFKQTFKGNATRYYFGIATNILVGGMYYAQVYNQNPSAINDIEYDDIYDGGLWNNVYDLLEDPTDFSKAEFKMLTSDLFKVWSECINPYWKHEQAAKYLANTLIAFFQIGVGIKYTVIGI